MNIYQIKFDYGYALADVDSALNGADSLDLCPENPVIINDFKYCWHTEESDIIPDFIVVMTLMLGCKSGLVNDVQRVIPYLNLHSVQIVKDDYVFFSNIPILSDCLNIKKSKITRFSNGDIMEITKPVFLPQEYPILFKVEEMSSSYFCTQAFKDWIETNSYTGLSFKQIDVKSKSWF